MILSGALSRLRWRLMAVACSSLVVTFGLWMAFNLGGSRATTWVGDPITIAVAALATLASTLKARSVGGRDAILDLGGSGRRLLDGWRSDMGLVRPRPRRADTPSPSVADIFYLLGEPVAIVGILLLASRRGEFTRGLRHVLDGFVIAGSLLFISWSTALGAVYRLGGTDLLGRVVALAYPVIDIIACTAALAALSKVRGDRRRALALIGFGLHAFAVSDSAYSYLTSINAYGSGSTFDTGYIAGYLLIFLAAVVPRSPETAPADEADASMFQDILPYVPLVLTVGVAVTRAMSGARFDGLLLGTAALTVIVVLVRQLLTVVENASLARRLQSSVVRLRERRRARTQGLARPSDGASQPRPVR